MQLLRAVLAQLYYFKPQTLNVSQFFLVIMTYFIGKAMVRPHVARVDIS
jgi:hypothetical protein